jgi:hypothetical protein
MGTGTTCAHYMYLQYVPTSVAVPGSGAFLSLFSPPLLLLLLDPGSGMDKNLVQDPGSIKIRILILKVPYVTKS